MTTASSKTEKSMTNGAAPQSDTASGTSFDDVAQQVREGTEAVRSAAEESLESLSKQLSTGAEDLQRVVTTTTQRHPLLVVGGALVLGTLIGAAMKRKG